MSLLPFEQELARATELRPFSNGFEGDAWMGAWCGNCARYDEAEDSGCVLVDVALVGSTPFGWEPMQWNSLTARYICREYRDKAMPADQ